MRIISRLALAVGVAAIVFVIVIVAAWSEIDNASRVCQRQWLTQSTLRRIGVKIDDYVRANPTAPERLADLPDLADLMLPENLRGPNGELQDEWQQPLQVLSDNGKVVVRSLGRDGAPGGVGPDADLSSDNRNAEAKRPSFFQFVNERDPMEIANSGFFFDGIVTALLVALAVFLPLLKQARRPESKSLRDTIIGIVVMVVLTVGAGIMLLPLHIPNGH